MKKELVMRLYFGLLASVLLVTLVAQCILTASEGRSLVNTFSYFTLQSNVLVLVTSVMLVIWPRLKSSWWRILRLAALTGITVTGIVYIFLLSRYVHITGIGLLYNYVFHYVMPVASVIGFIFLESKHEFRRRDFLFILWPVVWLVYTMVRGAYFNPQFTGFTTVPSKYPYEFLDVTRVSMTEVVVSIAFVSALIVGVGVAYVYADNRKKNREETPQLSMHTKP